jgi:hypothetical protein
MQEREGERERERLGRTRRWNSERWSMMTITRSKQVVAANGDDNEATRRRFHDIYKQDINSLTRPCSASETNRTFVASAISLFR